ncbi:uncharacterized protein LOC114299190 [Camellia sinensis]|uniref:uncharacterized protein LOC114299190 n=1 Tax=Camellia sinensis TaxID=4442 RepID=UPI0010360C32|nr:uncharacterized protein LOC114299190 [Camellia sinensis]
MVGFNRTPTWPLGAINLEVQAGPRNVSIEFRVIDYSSPYNAILGRPWLHAMRAIPSTLHQLLRFPTEQWIEEVRGDQVQAKNCSMTVMKSNCNVREAKKVEIKDKDMEVLDDVGNELAKKSEEALKKILWAGRPTLIHVEAVEEEVDKLLEANAIREVNYLIWLSNIVVVKKKNGRWRVYVDFTNLNKACPKDSFPLAKIDQLVDATSGHGRMSFLNTYKGYHQIAIYPPDEEKTSICLRFKASNNEAEYEALIARLKLKAAMEADEVVVFCDSQLIVNQATSKYVAQDERIIAYVKEITEYEAICVEMGPSWMDAMVMFLMDGKLPDDRKEAHKTRLRSARFSLIAEGHLYKRSFTGPLLRCVHPSQVEDFLYEIHEDVCGSHAIDRSLAQRAITQGYWWPYMQKDVEAYVGKCENCQKFAPLIH